MLEEFTSQWSDFHHYGQKTGFCPFEEIPLPVLAQSRMMVLSYPHNPTAAIAPFLFSNQLLPCQQHNLCWFTTSPCRLVFDDAAAPRFCKPTQKKLSRLSSSPYPSPTTWRLPRYYAIGNAKLIRP